MKMINFAKIFEKKIVIMNEIKLKRLSEDVEFPRKQSESAEGYDVRAIDIINVFKGDKPIDAKKLEKVKEGFHKRGYIKLRGFERILFSTGLQVGYLPEDYELQVRPRSGMAIKQGLTVINSPGTIDSDYRGIIGVGIYNSSPFLTTVNKYDRIAQIVPKVSSKHIGLVETEEIEFTLRGEEGFGSTGK